MDGLQIYSIERLLIDNIDEVCEDIKYQYESGISTCALFCLSLCPEGNPVADKVGEYIKKYIMFRDKLGEMGLKCGILVQSSIGHAAKSKGASLTPFEKYVSLKTGEKLDNHCPLNDDFCTYFKDIFASLAACEPEIIMLDDDFRLLSRSGAKGCACERHMADVKNRLGREITREELLDAMLDNPYGDEAKAFIESQRDALFKCARAMREGIDSVNPRLQGAFCSIENWIEFGAEIAKILAGEGNKVILRINNGHYTVESARFISKQSYRAAMQINQADGKADVILAETDTCPHNRYSTGAQSLHTHFAITILEGAKGAKHWITRSFYEPKSGKAYRKILQKNRGFYDELARLTPELKWVGCRIPIVKFNEYAFLSHGWDGSDGWSTHVLERLGLPLYFSSKNSGAAFLSGNADEKFNDEMILNLLKGPLLLSSDCAQNLIKRGFGKYLGVNVRDWKGKAPTREIFKDGKKACNVQFGIKELVPTESDTQIYSGVYHSMDNTNFTYLFPAITVYKNALGGTAVVFCGTPITKFHYATAFSFLNESRKEQMANLLRELNQLPVYYKGDEEVYFKAAKTNDDKMFCIIVNMGFDIIENVVLDVDFDVKEVKMLMSDGTYKDMAFEKNGSEIIISEKVYTLNPAVFVIG